MNGKGDGTYYDPGVGLSSCEWNYTNSDMVAAMNVHQFGDFARPANSPVCGACIKVTGPKGTVRVKVIDKCPVCKKGDVDLSESAFLLIADKDHGRVPISWHGC
ncbi:RlpA-like double-psi beta-barrel-protein domain-containing protein-containing protein [Thamnocephalis sphaerospora]|uniref:RlpA-like double-psi beta-barrel-protein domain-containing protein-containing protein n=1 Tax=Thamnocephalis sphaerospora TaxID=78915 RepID=A0A4P9XQ07_9FUNG|nr:RlpA-like double-psi beta-barrel-protein domain-containing protein-containing protein [Thamnocephalis sphaerospora]|eukprot:RKP08107.1 RlpA-like double-psi beta-barrel-protein domain-containing protein-containing protein [Thamnocephalis sphaerospora]